jgi:EF hand
MMAVGGSRFRSSLLDRYIAVVDALIVHPFPAQPLFPCEHRRRSFRRRGLRRGVADAILRGCRKGKKARKDRKQKDRGLANRSHRRAPKHRSTQHTTRFPLARGNPQEASPFFPDQTGEPVKAENGRKRRRVMISRRFVLGITAVAILSATASPVLAVSRRNAAMRMLDTDNDGTLDLAEAKKAASAVFARLDRDHDGTLDRRELRGRLSASEFAAADPDHDGTLTMEEYLGLVERRFNAANPDKDGTLDAKELNTSAGRALLRLLR